MLLGISSRPVNIVMPVVVNPLIVSKKPSMKPAWMPITNGRAPTAEKTVQPRLHIRSA